LGNGEKVRLVEELGQWMKVLYLGNKEGYVSAEYVQILEEYTYAKTLEEERKELEEKRALEQREKVSENLVPENTEVVPPPNTNYATNTELRSSIVNYALQYVGDKYVSGGTSLATGTDCSGFTMYVLKEFGYSISRTPQGQYTGAGRKISYSEIQPGDIICYSSNGGRSCTHVAFYIGDGKILHAANSKDGVKISSATYDDIYGVRNVID
jgi:cell wall-associated NlpC family hydrolase